MSLTRAEEKEISELFGAIDKDDLQKVKQLLKLIPVDIKQFHDTPLIYAIKRSKNEIATFLLENKASTKEVDGLGQTALFHAYDNPGLVEKLLKMNSEVNHQDDYGNTPLHLYVQEWNLDAIELLIAHGAEVNRVNKKRLSPLETLLEASIPLTWGDIFHYDHKRFTDRLSHFELKREMIAAKLVESGAVIDKNLKCPPLIRAVALGFYPIVHLFLKKGADTNINNFRNTTPLFQSKLSLTQYRLIRERLAIRLKNKNLPDWKLEELKSRHNRASEQIENQENIQTVLLKFGALEKIQRPNTISYYQKLERRLAFLTAVIERDWDGIKELARLGVNVNMTFLRFKRFYGAHSFPDGIVPSPKDTPLSYAIMCKDEFLTEILIEAGANIFKPINRKDKSFTLLMMAASTCYAPTIRLLVQHGLKPYHKDMNGKSSFDYIEGHSWDHHSDSAMNKAREALLTKAGLPSKAQKQFMSHLFLFKSREKIDVKNNASVAPSPARGNFTRS